MTKQKDKWLLSASIQPNGDMYPFYTLIDHTRSHSARFYTDKHCLPNEIQERVALIRIKRGDYSPCSLGKWVGERHFVIVLDKDEYHKLLEIANGYTGK
jgi:hypothetical protein